MSPPRASSGRIRVSAQLINAETGFHEWAEKYDRDEPDLLIVQDEIVEQVAGALLGWEGRISRATRRRARQSSSDSLKAYERYLLAYEAQATMTRIDTERAIELADSALALDPTLARAWLVRAYAFEHASSLAGRRTPRPQTESAGSPSKKPTGSIRRTAP